MVEVSTLMALQHIDQLRRFCAHVITREDAGYDDMAPAAVSARAQLAVANRKSDSKSRSPVRTAL